MAIEKLEVDVPLVLDDDVLFAHTIDEVIGNVFSINGLLFYLLIFHSSLIPTEKIKKF